MSRGFQKKIPEFDDYKFTCNLQKKRFETHITTEQEKEMHEKIAEKGIIRIDINK